MARFLKLSDIQSTAHTGRETITFLLNVESISMLSATRNMSDINRGYRADVQCGGILRQTIEPVETIEKLIELPAITGKPVLSAADLETQEAKAA